MDNKKEILNKRFKKLEKHYCALQDYKQLIDAMITQKDIYQPDTFNALDVQERAVLDAYLKRFASVQDFLGAKIFAPLLEMAGISNGKMSEVLYLIEKEEIIDSLGNWIELREIRNELEHDYPENLVEALQDLKFCVDNFSTIESYYLNSLAFAKRYMNEVIK
ncbi:MAG: hypothetical protein DRQ62_06530 [Gammaproteobacteria bacterium]|nr:MAG: hypothetical protein DRQ62_06530 [Gammaproteobacteria bacterium]